MSERIEEWSVDGLKQENRNESNVNLFNERWRDGENNNNKEIAIHSFTIPLSNSLHSLPLLTTHSIHHHS